MQIFKGKISNVNKQVLSHTSGSTSVSTGAFTGKVSGSGSVETHHEHYAEFELDGKVFRCDGDYMFKDGDSVALGAYDNGQGFWQVKILKNATRNFYFSHLRKRIALGGFIGGLFGGFFGFGFLFWVVWWALNKFVFDGSIGNSKIAFYAYCVAVVVSSILTAIKFYKSVNDERKTAIYFEGQIKDYAG